MLTTQHRSPSLATTLWPAQENTLIRNLVLAILGSLALWASAKIQIPFWPVPMTMQTFVVLLIGATFGWRLGMATVVLYLAEGAAGLPVFAGTPEKGIGLAYMASTTGGYLFGFIIAAGAVGWLAERGWDRSLLGTALSMTLGTAVIFAFGILWLGTLLGWDKPILEWGLTPFLAGAAFKIALAVAVLPLAWKAIKGKK